MTPGMFVPPAGGMPSGPGNYPAASGMIMAPQGALPGAPGMIAAPMAMQNGAQFVVPPTNAVVPAGTMMTQDGQQAYQASPGMQPMGQAPNSARGTAQQFPQQVPQIIYGAPQVVAVPVGVATLVAPADETNAGNSALSMTNAGLLQESNYQGLPVAATAEPQPKEANSDDVNL